MKYSHYPSSTQFRLFANIKYVEAKNYMRSRRRNRKASADLPIQSKPRLSVKPRSQTSNSKPIPNTSISHFTFPVPNNTKRIIHNTHSNQSTNNIPSSQSEPPPKYSPQKIISPNTNINTVSITPLTTPIRSETVPDQEHVKAAHSSTQKTKLYTSISLPIHRNNNSSPSVLTHFSSNHNPKNRVNLSVTKAGEDGYIYIHENYYHKRIIDKNHPYNASGQDLRKYSGIEAHDHNGYYHEMDYKNDLRSNMNNPYLDHKVLQSLMIHTFKLYVAIDFGTDGCSISYCLPNGNVYIHGNWRGEKLNKVDIDTKIKSRILLDKNGERLAFGFAASYMYSNINKNNDQDWMLFERFKMNLGRYLKATNGTVYESRKVFVSVFQFMKEQVWCYLKKLKLHHTVKSIRDIQWIITVPAIWDDVAKNKMREWAFDAGLADETIPNHIKIVYEPDCASLSIQHKIMQMHRRKDRQQDTLLFVHNTQSVRDSMHLFAKGSRYLVIDAGGGTVDVSCHETMGDMKIKEVLCPSGGNWGSTCIDDEFMKLLDNIFTKQWMKRFIDEDSHSYYQLLSNFRSAKHSFYDKENNTKKHNVDLTYEFISFLEEECERHSMYLDDIISKSIYCNDIALNGEYLEMSHNIWANVMFGVVIDPIIAHVESLLHREEMKECTFICLVGGLGASTYFQYKIHEIFGDKLAIIIPKSPILCVVEGAALFGLFNTFVQGRVLSKCYGTSVNSQHLNKSWMNKNMVSNLSDQEKEKHYNHKRECYCKIFKPIVYKNQIVSIDGKPIIIEGARNTSNKAQKHTTVKIYQCNEYNDNSNTFFINTSCVNNGNMKLMATACIVWPKDDKQRNKIILELYFHDTTIRGYVYAEKYPDDRKMLQLRYQFQ